MNHAGHLAAVFGLDRDTVAAVSLGDDGVLQISPRGAIDHAGQGRMNLVVGRQNGAAYMVQGRAGVVAYLILRENTAADFAGELGTGLQRVKKWIEGIRIFLPALVLTGILLRPGRCLQKGADVQKLRNI